MNRIDKFRSCKTDLKLKLIKYLKKKFNQLLNRDIVS